MSFEDQTNAIFSTFSLKGNGAVFTFEYHGFITASTFFFFYMAIVFFQNTQLLLKLRVHVMSYFLSVMKKPDQLETNDMKVSIH